MDNKGETTTTHNFRLNASKYHLLMILILKLSPSSSRALDRYIQKIQVQILRRPRQTYSNKRIELENEFGEINEFRKLIGIKLIILGIEKKVNCNWY